VLFVVFCYLFTEKKRKQHCFLPGSEDMSPSVSDSGPSTLFLADTALAVTHNDSTATRDNHHNQHCT